VKKESPLARNIRKREELRNVRHSAKLNRETSWTRLSRILFKIDDWDASPAESFSLAGETGVVSQDAIQHACGAETGEGQSYGEETERHGRKEEGLKNTKICSIKKKVKKG